MDMADGYKRGEDERRTRILKPSSCVFLYQGNTDELATLSKHFDLVVSTIRNPSTLVEDSCKAGIIQHREKEIIIQSQFEDVQSKTRCFLRSIMGKIKREPYVFHHFLNVLWERPETNNLAATLQCSFCKYLVDELCKSSLVNCVYR